MKKYKIIKTITAFTAKEFDSKVNEAIYSGWVVQRFFEIPETVSQRFQYVAQLTGTVEKDV